MNFHAQSISQVLEAVQADQTQGLSAEQADRRRRERGSNTLPKSTQTLSALRIFLHQWRSPLIIILLVAGTASVFLREHVDAVIIYGTAGFNALIGFFQEYKANRALEKLRSMVEYKALILRDGVKKYIPSTDIVVGDILFFTPGDKIQADGRLLVADHIEINEATVTGESAPVKKQCEAISEEAVLGDRNNMIYRGTEVVMGEGCAVITAIGRDTEIGRIATMVEETKEEETPLQRQLGRLARTISVMVVVIAVGLFGLGVLLASDTYHPFELFETSVAVAVAAIPEGLAISLTVILAIGMQQILKRRALVRRPLAAETLGSVSVLCVDKTGTLTEGRMRVSHLLTPNMSLTTEEIRRAPLQQPEYQCIRLSLHIGALANTGSLENPSASEQAWRFTGDTTDVALLHMAAVVGMEKQALDKTFPRIANVPFSSEQKYAASLHQGDLGKVLYVKGAPEVILSHSVAYESQGTHVPVDTKMHTWFEEQMKSLTQQGYRTLAVAYKPMDGATTLQESDVEDLIFVGLFAISDPLRAEVKDTLRVARQAGIRTIMITGDHAQTAQTIAQEIGLARNGSVCDGAALDTLSDDELTQTLRHTDVFARVDPKHKIRIVRALQKQGEVVAMTGDGVNDAPALKGADIGIAVGSGTDVAKEIADLVLLDDGVTTIVAAIEEGRRIYQNIKKVVLYLLSSSFSEVILIAGSLITGMPLAVLPAQILWINIIEESFPTIALAFDKGEVQNMSDAPRKKSSSLLDQEMKAMIGIISVLSSLILFGIFVYMMKATQNLPLARTIMFAGLGVGPLLYIYSVRSMRSMIWSMNPLNNHFLTGSIVFGWAMLLIAIYVRPFQLLLKTVPLSAEHWLVLFAFAGLNVCLIEIIKWIFLIRKKV